MAMPSHDLRQNKVKCLLTEFWPFGTVHTCRHIIIISCCGQWTIRTTLFDFLMLFRTLTWSYLPSLNTARQLHSMGIFQGKFIIVKLVSSNIMLQTVLNVSVDIQNTVQENVEIPCAYFQKFVELRTKPLIPTI